MLSCTGLKCSPPRLGRLQVLQYDQEARLELLKLHVNFTNIVIVADEHKEEQLRLMGKQQGILDDLELHAACGANTSDSITRKLRAVTSKLRALREAIPWGYSQMRQAEQDVETLVNAEASLRRLLSNIDAQII